MVSAGLKRGNVYPMANMPPCHSRNPGHIWYGLVGTRVKTRVWYRRSVAVVYLIQCYSAVGQSYTTVPVRVGTVPRWQECILAMGMVFPAGARTVCAGEYARWGVIPAGRWPLHTPKYNVRKYYRHSSWIPYTNYTLPRTPSLCYGNTVLDVFIEHSRQRIFFPTRTDLCCIVCRITLLALSVHTAQHMMWNWGNSPTHRWPWQVMGRPAPETELALPTGALATWQG